MTIGYGGIDNLVDVIERIYAGSMNKFEMESIMIGWYKKELGIEEVRCKQVFNGLQ